MVSDSLAVLRSLVHMTGTKTDGKKVDMWTRSTVFFRKEGGAWKVTGGPGRPSHHPMPA
jgi:ketosteroid isomerase-like protein